MWIKKKNGAFRKINHKAPEKKENNNNKVNTNV